MAAEPQPSAPRLRPPRHLVSPTAVWYWTTRAAIGWVLLLAGEVAWLLGDSANAGWHAAGLVITAVLAAAHLIVMPRWRYRVHRWEVTNVAVYTQAGWFHQERRIAPLSRIQTVDSERGPIEQLFGLVKVTANTASAAGPLRITGLDRETAQGLVDELTTIAQQTPGDAT
ncbi:MAG TPA: PH domain-containing protein [Candidatus Acidoferrales bacterium]|nr:PH domain-containing protein [Candidatus Acidoferrales bacterium]